MKFKILGNGPLCGPVRLSGAKNSALRMLAASILNSSPLVLEKFPSSLLDAKVHIEMLEQLGKSCQLMGPEKLLISDSGTIKSELHWKGRSIRNTLLILGALVARNGFGSVPLPGGCKLGERSYDLHVMLLEKMGAKVWEKNSMLMAEGKLCGADIQLPIRSTGATENAIIAGSLAKGITRVWNPHIRPEIIDLITMLNQMGGKIKVFGQEHIEVEGVNEFKPVTYKIMPDNMEAITWLVASVITGGDIEIFDFPLSDLEIPLIHLRESGARFFVGQNSLIVRGGTCFPLEISTGPYPGINSDVQPILAAYAACAFGESRIIDLRFPGRYGYASEMKKMGLKYEIDGNMIKINGKRGNLLGAKVKALDLRAGAALTLAALVAEGETVIEDAWQIERGYNNFLQKLNELGADVEGIE